MKTSQVALITFLLLALNACKNEPKQNNTEPEAAKTIVEKIANANGLENFETINELKYTFNVKVNDSLRTSRAWTWSPKSGKVKLVTEDSTVTYNHKSQAAQHQWVDERFINDQYWLLFPFHLAWDDLEYTHEEAATAPISGKTYQKLTVTYPQDKGYTPGDVYELFLDEDLLIQEWLYRPGGSLEKSFPATWEDYKELGGIRIATRHKNKDGSFELFFSDITVKE